MIARFLQHQPCSHPVQARTSVHRGSPITLTCNHVVDHPKQIIILLSPNSLFKKFYRCHVSYWFEHLRSFFCFWM
jgi:hypothetical protein